MSKQIKIKENEPLAVCLKVGNVEKRIVITQYRNVAIVDIFGNCNAHLNILSYDESKVKPSTITTTYLYKDETSVILQVS